MLGGGGGVVVFLWGFVVGGGGGGFLFVCFVGVFGLLFLGGVWGVGVGGV